MSMYGNGRRRDGIPLNSVAVKKLPRDVSSPEYDRSTLQQSLAHIGVGGFFRSHQAVYLDDLINLTGSMEWAYCGIGLLEKDAEIARALQEQDYLYSVTERSIDGDFSRIIGSMVNYLYAPHSPEAVLQQLANPITRIVSLTITENGYYINSGTGQFEATHPDIVYDLAHPLQPRCSFGYLAEALNRRRQNGIAPFTLMSCDNIQRNGDVLKKMLVAFCRLRNPELGLWLEMNGSFPNSMVDRITPATTEEHRKFVSKKIGLNDKSPVISESFKQWIIEDVFPLGRPAWQLVGANMTDNVVPYEKMKLRLLNASHQALCHIGLLLGYTYTSEALDDPLIKTLVQKMMDIEVTPLLDPIATIDINDYKRKLIERFSNEAIKDQLSRIASDGSAKIPKFVFPSLREQLQVHGPSRMLTFTVASWFRYLQGIDDNGLQLPLNDANSDLLHECIDRGKGDVLKLLSLHEIFGDLADYEVFVDELQRQLRCFHDHGARGALHDVVTSIG